MASKFTRPMQAAALVVFCALPVHASEDRSARKATSFDWFANAATPVNNDEATARTKAAIQKARVLTKGASWVCSPAGSGQKAACYKS